MRELYRLVLVDTPLAPYFSENITSDVISFRLLFSSFLEAQYQKVRFFIFQDLDEMNIEIMRNTLYKAYLEDFYRFCQVLIPA